MYRILRELTKKISTYASLLLTYHNISGEYDFINAKAKFAIDVQGNYPLLHDKAHVHLLQAYHPLLYLYNKKNNKQTIPTNIELNEKNRILVISGPNAGRENSHVENSWLVAIDGAKRLAYSVFIPDSEVGIFKQIMIHIGDTQSLEFELSTYSLT